MLFFSVSHSRLSFTWNSFKLRTHHLTRTTVWSDVAGTKYWRRLEPPFAVQTEVASTGSARSSACVHSQSTGSGLALLLLKREKGGKGREGSGGGIGWMADEASNFCFCWSNMHRKNKRDFFSSQNVFFFFSILFGRSATFGDFFLLVFRQVIQRVKLRLSFLFPAYLTIWIIT